MEISVKVEDLRKNNIFVATPMYGGMCSGQYCKSVVDLSVLCGMYGVKFRISYLFNESLITRARNYLVDEFLRSDCTQLMFIDSDIGFDPRDVLSLSVLASDPDKSIVCGPYPKKTISWEKVKMAVDKGFADQNPNVLERYVGDFVFNPVQGVNEIRIDTPVEVMEGGTGFMMIRRDTFEKFAEAYKDKLTYLPDHVRTKNFDGSREIMAYFDTVIDPDSRRYLSEDYMFCQWARKIGLKVWLCPWMKTQHVGSYIYGGGLQDLAAIGAAATADTSKLKKI